MSRTLSEILRLPLAVFSGNLTKPEEITPAIHEDLAVGLRIVGDFYKKAQEHRISQCSGMNLKVNPLFSGQARPQSTFNQDKICDIVLNIQLFQESVQKNPNRAQLKQHELLAIRAQLRPISVALENEISKFNISESHSAPQSLAYQAASELKERNPDPQKIERWIDELQVQHSEDAAYSETLKTMQQIQRACYLKAATMTLHAARQSLLAGEDPVGNLEETLRLIAKSAHLTNLLST